MNKRESHRDLYSYCLILAKRIEFARLRTRTQKESERKLDKLETTWRDLKREQLAVELHFELDRKLSSSS